jgi:DNA-binding MarR family transcriptional regulator
MGDQMGEKIATRKLPSKQDFQNSFIHKIHLLSHSFKKSATIAYRDLHDIGRSERAVLASLGFHKRIISRDIANRSLIDKAQVSRTLNNLNKKNLISRLPDAEDRRCEWIELTEEGKALFKETQKTAKRRHQRVLKGFKPTEIELLESLFDQLFILAEEMYEEGVIKSKS